MKWAAFNNGGWQLWFAWHPVLVGDDWVWWEKVERFLHSTGQGESPSPHCTYYEYRLHENSREVHGTC